MRIADPRAPETCIDLENVMVYSADAGVAKLAGRRLDRQTGEPRELVLDDTALAVTRAPDQSTIAGNVFRPSRSASADPCSLSRPADPAKCCASQHPCKMIRFVGPAVTLEL